MRVDTFPASPPGFVWVLFHRDAPSSDEERSEQVFDTAKEAAIDGWRALWARRARQAGWAGSAPWPSLRSDEGADRAL